MYHISRNMSQEGVSTLEILIAMAIMILSISAVILVVFGNQSLAIDTQTNQEGLYKSRSLLETSRNLARQDMNLLVDCDDSTGIKCAGATDSFYSRKIRTSNLDAFMKEVVSEVTWSGLRPNLKVELPAIFSDWQALNTGNTCSQTLSGDWKNPQMASYELGKDFLSDPASAYPITDVLALRDRLYLTVNNTHPNSNSSFFIFNLTTPTSPTFLTSLDNDSTVGAGLNAVAIGGKYAYVASARAIDFSKPCSGGNCGQLQIIDISVSPPVLKTSFLIPGISGKSGQSIGTSIAYRAGIVYLGLAKTLTGPEFNIIDVGGGGSAGASPLHPVYLGGYSVGNAVNAIRLMGKYALIATPNSENLTVIDTTNFARVGGSASQTTGGANGMSLAALNNKIYLGRAFGTNEFYIFDASNPETTLPVITSKDTGTGNKTSIHGLVVRDHLGFFITELQFQIWDLISPIIPWAGALDLPGSSTAMSCNDNYLYVASLPVNEKSFLSIISSGP